MPRALALVAAFALVVYALADFASSDEQDRGGIPRWLWLVIIVVLPYFGPVAWIVFSRSRRAQAAGGPRRPGAAGGRGAAAGRGRRRPSGPVAPDDDPDFLWRLAQEQRKQGRGPAGTTGPAGATGTDGSGTATPGADERDEDGRDEDGPDGSADALDRPER